MLRERAFVVSLLFSALFHLSMVTIFSIGIWFPATPTRYYSFRIVPQSPATSSSTSPGTDVSRQVLRVPDGGHPLDLFSDALVDSAQNPAAPAPRLTGADGLLGGLPPVELPKLEFAGLERLRLQRESLEIRQRYESFWEYTEDASWFDIGRGWARLRDALSIGDTARDPAERYGIMPHPVSGAAPGFDLYIEWMSEPKNRQLLFSPPIEALTNASPHVVGVSTNFVFRVAPDGRVKEVLPGSPGIDVEFADSVAAALTNYRFAPLEQGNSDQYGTLIIRPAGARHD